MKVYLDTSVLSALFDARNPERQELTKEFFSRIDAHEVFISELTRVEIEETPDEQLRDKMRGVIASFHVLPSQEQKVMGKTTEKIDEKIIKGVEREFPGDPVLQQIHIARKLISLKAKKLGVSLHEYITRHSARK